MNEILFNVGIAWRIQGITQLKHIFHPDLQRSTASALSFKAFSIVCEFDAHFWCTQSQCVIQFLACLIMENTKEMCRKFNVNEC